MKNTTDQFKSRLQFYREKGWIKLLHRGINKRFAFNQFNLDITYNTIEQFGELLFYFGEKSKYYWEQKVGKKIGLNDVSMSTFEYIFNCFNEIALRGNPNRGTFNYRKKNRPAFLFFSDKENLHAFTSEILKLRLEDKTQRRNYYLRIIHQLGETSHKKTSLHISTTTELEVARDFSKGDIVIKFWDFDFGRLPLMAIKVPDFIGKPYKNQKEISLFSVIFPHYIYSFEYSGKLYYNPAIFSGINIDSMILNGFVIDQSKFRLRLQKETNYRSGVWSNGSIFREINVKRRSSKV